MAGLTGVATVQDWADACGFQEHREAFFVKLRRAKLAKEIFENCNLRMVAKIANRYVSQGVDMEVCLVLWHSQPDSSQAQCYLSAQQRLLHSRCCWGLCAASGWGAALAPAALLERPLPCAGPDRGRRRGPAEGHQPL